MFDFDATVCRICLEDDAMYPIFEGNEKFENVYAELPMCIREKLEDLEGYPRNICLKCKNTSETISNFISMFENTCEILKDNIVVVKTENLQDHADGSDNETEPFIYELQLYEAPSVKQITVKRDTTELLESLSHLTVKRIKLEPETETSVGSQEEASNEKEDKAKRKRGNSNKADSNTIHASVDNVPKTKAVTKKGGLKAAQKKLSKPAAQKKARIKPVSAKNNVETKQSSTDVSKPRPEQKGQNNRLDLDTKQENEETLTSLLCDHCGATYSQSASLKKHILHNHTEMKFNCTECPKRYVKEQDFIDHKKIHDNVRTCICETCGKGFTTNKILRGHIRVVHNHIKSKRDIQKCKYCDKTFKCKRGILVHERSVHTGERPDVCQICGGSFFDVVYLREHMRLHTGEKPYKCPVCGRGYAQRGNMKSHMRNHRISQLDPDTLAKVRPSYYKFMKPLAHSKQEFIFKKEAIEIGENKAIDIPKLCDICGMTCATAKSLTNHKKVHKERKYECTLCPKTYLTARSLKLHRLSLHEKAKTAFCDYCGKAFFTKHNMRSHITNVHLKMKKTPLIYKCGYCDKTFKYKKGAIIHERAVHTGERPAMCDICGNSFYDESYLREHRLLHTGDTPHKCPVCGRGYAQRGNMKSHMRNHRISQLDPDTLAKIKPNYFKFMRP